MIFFVHAAQDEMLGLVMEKAYDSFTLKLDHFQVLYAAKGMHISFITECGRFAIGV